MLASAQPLCNVVLGPLQQWCAALCWLSDECQLLLSGALICCNAAAVMKHGQVVEQGSHAELERRPGGAYATLIKLQPAARRGSNQV